MPKYPETLTVTVTQDDIFNGVRLISEACPIALALMRFGWKTPHVGTNFAFNMTRRDTAPDYDLDVGACTFIEHFDVKEPVVPGTFTLTRRKKRVRP